MTLDIRTAKKTEEVQIAIRLKQSDGYRYETHVDHGPGVQSGNTPRLTLESAKKQLNLYTASAEATVVTREVLIYEGIWEEVQHKEIYDLAALLHKKQCHFNHIDQCGWDYEDWKGYTHRAFLKKAEKMRAAEPTLDFETILNIVKAL